MKSTLARQKAKTQLTQHTPSPASPPCGYQINSPVQLNKHYASSMVKTPGWTGFPDWRSMCSCCFVAFACCEAQCCSQYNSIGFTTPGVDRLPIVSCKHEVSKQFLLHDITRKACSKASISATLSLDVPFNLCTAGCSHRPVQRKPSTQYTVKNLS